jgi:glucose/arabinose dehydrogenase
MRSLVVALALLVAASAVRAGTPVAGFSDDPVISGLSQPTAAAFLPDGRLLVTQQGGNLLRVESGVATVLTTIPVCSASEMGLLGVAIDPAFATNGFVYLYRTKPAPGGCGSAAGRFNQVVRVTVTGNTAGSLTELLDGIQTDNTNHDGGGLQIGPDGKLYVGVGDTGLLDNMGGPGSAMNPYSQDLAHLEGKVLRLDLDGSIPADNPFVSTAGARAEIFAYGFRNPFRFGFDPMTDALWLGDVGDLTIEELDIVTSGGNYAWPHCEGTLPTGCEAPGDIDPIFTYDHSVGATIIGGAFAPAGFGSLGGHYFFADFTARVIFHGVPNPARNGLVGTPAQFVTAAGGGFGGPVDVIFGPDGALYYVQFNPGEVRRVAPTGSGGAAQLLTGKKLLLKAGADPAKKKLSVQSKDAISLGAGNGSLDDPTLNGGSLRVMSAGFDDTYPMPSGNWSYIGAQGDGKGYLYRDKNLSAGPVGKAVMKNGKLVKASGKGPGLGHSLAADPNPVATVLTTGARKYCMSFGGTAQFQANKSYSAKDAPAPGACPP